MNKIFVVYNAHTMDGQAAALAAYYKFGDHATFLAFDYGKLSIFDYFTRGNHLKVLYVLGLHLTPKDAARLSSFTDQLVYIDHLPLDIPESIANKVRQFSIKDRSTCVSAWAHFMPDKKIPEMYRIIEDVSLFRNDIHNSRLVYDGLRYKMLQCEDDAFLLNMRHFVDPNVSELAVEGMQVGSYFRTLASYLASNSGYCNFLGRRAAFINAPKLFAYRIVQHLLSSGKYDYVLLYADCRVSGYTYRSWSVGCRHDLKYNAAYIASIFEGFGTSEFAGFVSSLEFKDIQLTAEVENYVKQKTVNIEDT